MRLLRPALALALALSAAPAAAFTPERAAMMVGAIRANGCAMRGDEAAGALGPLGLEPIEVQAFVDTLYGAGMVTMSPDSQVLILAVMLCAASEEASLEMITEAFAAQENQIERWRPEFEPERGAELIAVVRTENCVLTDARAEEILPPLGFTPVSVRDIVAVLVDGELAQVNDEGTEMRLSDAVCSGDPAADAPALAALIASWEERHPAPGVVIEDGTIEEGATEEGATEGGADQ